MSQFGTVTILGVGLIGGSIGKTLRSLKLADHVIGVGRNQTRLQIAQSLGAIDSYTTNLEEAVPASSLVVVCTPVDRIASDLIQCASLGGRDLLLTDAGSTKQGIVERVSQFPKIAEQYVGAHPIAGSERSGVEASRSDLLQDSVCVLTPTEFTSKELLERARLFWSSLGCKVASMAPEDHDKILSQMSHLPHILAVALANSVPATSLDYGGGAFRDMTRIAASDPGIWISILLENRNALLQTLHEYQNQLNDFGRLLDQSDTEQLEKWWLAANKQRERFQGLQRRPPPKAHTNDTGFST